MRGGLRYGTVAAALAALLLTGCSSGGASGGGTPRPGHHGAAAAAPSASARPADDTTCGKTPDSYRPAGTQPQPGHMPAGSTMAAIAARGRLIAGVDQNSYLFGYRNPLTGQLDGYEIELLKRISTALFGSPDRIQFRTITSAQRIPVLLQKQDPVDIVIDSMTVNCERWKSVAFSSDYMDAGQRVLVPKDSAATSIDDLGGKKVCAASGTTSIDTLTGLKDHPVVPVGVKDWTDCLMLMQLGQVDAVSTDDTILIGLQRQDPNTKLIGPRFTAEPHGIAMQPQQVDFVRFVNGVLEQMRQDGSLKKLAQDWLGDGATFGPPPAVYRD
ncbi:Amino acid ABC transporter substrate-binding protein, PAAT family [Actinacidiphila bryophytorum]|uniref:Amino acid ABC transporter substrate-binding protein, PAAT family n=1 Tax=Actinacidiphila bryophytorum TaxID=1436133 RepID=A0A9W4H7R1_9ACTN|nr:Amino acid ABC transporter substrate-binding protein, PAAT family [Actinacidiphila bryophytorum]